VAVFWLGQPLKSQAKLSFIKNRQINFALLDKMSKALRPGETLVVCRNEQLPTGAVSYFASKGQPFEMITPSDFAEMEQKSQPYRGFCPAAEFDVIRKSLDSYEVVDQAHGWIQWRSPGVRGAK